MWVPLPRLTPKRSPPRTCSSWRPATPRRSAPTRSITSDFGIVRNGSSRTPSLAPRGSWSSRSAGPCRTSRTHLAAATTSTIVRSTPCDRLRSTPRAPPSPERPVPRPIPTVSLGAWSWTGDGFVSEFRCNDGNLGERRHPAALTTRHRPPAPYLEGAGFVSEQIEREIEAVLETRTGRECVFMPSGRFAIHLAFRLLLSPGDRILMSPLEDDTVFFGALAAGLRPVMAPVSTHDGNMRTDAIDDATWSTISAVLTGNTYGLPDRVVELSATCGRWRIPLIEDAAHALETDIDGHPIGSFGAVSAFSFSKHFPGRGGVLAVERGSTAGTSPDCAIDSCCRGRLAREWSASRDHRPERSWRPSISRVGWIARAAWHIP